MNPELLSKEKVVYFFNKYKYNSNRIYVLERQLLNESCKSQKWELLLKEISDLTRQLYIKNEALLDAYFRPALESPQQLRPDTIQTFLLHITFFLFENNIDSLITEDLINSFLAHPEVLDMQSKFSALMNLGICRTMSCEGSFEETQKIFEEAVSIFPTYESTPSYDTRVHLAFCRVYQMLAFDLYGSDDYKDFVRVYNETYRLLRTGDEKLYKKMWGEKSDAQFHIDYLMRFLRIYGIFMAGKAGFDSSRDESPENVQALDTIIHWLTDEFEAEKKEGEVNLMVFTFYNKYRHFSGEISDDEYFNLMNSKFEEQKAFLERTRDYIFPESSFPVDDDPVDPVFSRMLDKMKLFNRTFSYIYVFLMEFAPLSADENLNREIIQEAAHFFEASKYAEKGFKTDKFEIDLMRTIAQKMTSINEFLIFFQTVFIHRQISTSNHIGMVSSIVGVCFYRFVEKRPDLFFIPGKIESVEDVEKYKMDMLRFIKAGALLHDIGKLGNTALINLHFRKITDREYGRIKTHSSLGGEIVKGIPYLEIYRDFILGHHKFWNDEKGYPESFKVQKSAYKYYIGLITLADCIDSVTDAEGRNYATKKKFDDIFDELRDGAGSRYCPELVDLLMRDENLLNQLRMLTSTGRNLNLRKTYLRFIEHNIHFSEQEEKTVSLLNDTLYKRLPDFYKTCYPSVESEKIVKYLDSFTSSWNGRMYIMHDKTNRIYGVMNGFITSSIDEPDYFYIKEFIMLPDFRRKGFGTKLLMAVSRLLKCEDVNNLKLNVQTGSPDEAFFWIDGFSKSKSYLMELGI